VEKTWTLSRLQEFKLVKVKCLGSKNVYMNSYATLELPFKMPRLKQKASLLVIYRAPKLNLKILSSKRVGRQCMSFQKTETLALLSSIFKVCLLKIISEPRIPKTM
jgi:hypothetical protein